jgi:Zn ribbon nucleic-acid-binding protein
MAYLPDDLFNELHAELSSLMSVYMEKDTEIVECVFCGACDSDVPNDGAPDIKHTARCLGMRLIKAMDKEVIDRQGSG